MAAARLPRPGASGGGGAGCSGRSSVRSRSGIPAAPQLTSSAAPGARPSLSQSLSRWRGQQCGPGPTLRAREVLGAGVLRDRAARQAPLCSALGNKQSRDVWQRGWARRRLRCRVAAAAGCNEKLERLRQPLLEVCRHCQRGLRICLDRARGAVPIEVCRTCRCSALYR